MRDMISQFAHDTSMRIVRRKPGFPVYCPRCERPTGWPNGFCRRAAKGIVQQARCAECKYQWPLPKDDVQALFSGHRVHVPLERLLKAMACVVLGFPMSAAEKLVGIKAETIKAKLVGLLNGHGWETLDDVFDKRFGISKFDREEFWRAIVVGREFDPAAFRCWSKEFRRSTPAERAQLLRRIARIVGRPLRAVIWAVRLRQGQPSARTHGTAGRQGGFAGVGGGDAFKSPRLGPLVQPAGLGLPKMDG